MNHIAPGLCNLLDVAVAFLKGVERTCGWVGAAVQYVATKLFLVHRYDTLLTPPHYFSDFNDVFRVLLWLNILLCRTKFKL